MSLLDQAKAEGKRSRCLLDQHAEVIAVLRDEKSMTWKAIAQWFAERKIYRQHEVFRLAYIKHKGGATQRPRRGHEKSQGSKARDV